MLFLNKMLNSGDILTSDGMEVGGGGVGVGGWGWVGWGGGVGDKYSQRRENTGSVAPPRQDMLHPGLSGSRGRPALGSGCFLQDWSGNYQDKP